ncbi:MAG: hypothetical protein NUW37_07100 [Planctomycetes bacterium]|nr:hypothetical protein [Planctomycetota bacterium]
MSLDIRKRFAKALLAISLSAVFAQVASAQSPEPPPPTPEDETSTQPPPPMFVPGTGSGRNQPEGSQLGTSGGQNDLYSGSFTRADHDFSFSVTSLLTKDVQVVSAPVPIPISLISEGSPLSMSLNLSYIFRNYDTDDGTTISAKGLGDISLSASYQWRLIGMNYVTSMRIKFPTGDWENTANGVPLPFGTGQMEYGMFQDWTVDFNLIRFFTTMGYEYKPSRGLTFPNDSGVDERYHVDNGEIFHYMFGGSIPTWWTWLHWYGKVGGLYQESTRALYQGSFIDLEDGMITADYLTGFHIYLQEDALWGLFRKGDGFKFGVIIPLWTKPFEHTTRQSRSRSLGFEVGFLSEWTF